MKKVLSLLVVGAVVMSAASASASDYFRFGFASRTAQKAPAAFGPAFIYAEQPATAAPAPTPVPMPKGHAHSHAVGAPLFHCVRYKDLRNIAPCAVSKIVLVKDPRACCDPCACCTPKCVAVRICVPPCGCPKITCNKDGSKVKYDYGNYEIEISSRKGRVTVDYDD